MKVTSEMDMDIELAEGARVQWTPGTPVTAEGEQVGTVTSVAIEGGKLHVEMDLDDDVALGERRVNDLSIGSPDSVG